jgi:hypothetical protein
MIVSIFLKSNGDYPSCVYKVKEFHYYSGKTKDIRFDTAYNNNFVSFTFMDPIHLLIRSLLFLRKRFKFNQSISKL